uniref:DUF1559 domain-containing protein n=1 Tax=Schlesneria paludicola TaxID=360056 RepID=A0A7C4LNW8_9PLAN
MVRPREKGRPPEGFTVVELLVVLGVFSLVMALVVPAVQSSRENSRRLDCASRLKQIMLATEAFASQHLHYPEYSSGGIDGQGVKHWNVCPFVEILPFIDQVDVFRRINRDRWIGSYDSYGSGQLYSGQNAEFVKLSIPLYQCPRIADIPAVVITARTSVPERIGTPLPRRQRLTALTRRTAMEPSSG